MITASQNFIDAVNGNGRNFRAKIKRGSTEVPCNIVEIKTTKGACDEQTFAIGSVFSSSAEIAVSGLETALLNEDITVQIGVLTSDGYDYIDYGKYTVIRAPKSASRTTLSAVGFISSKLNVPLPDTTDTPTIQAVASAIATASGVSVTFVGFTGLTKTLPHALKGMTCRGALEIITFLVGGFATENNAGGIEIHKFSIPQSPTVFPQGRSLTEPVRADEAFDMTGVKVIVTEESEDDEGTVIPEVSYESGNPIRQTYQSEYMTESIFSTFAANVVGYEFMPATVDMSLGDPRLEPWDVLAVTYGEDDTENVPCHLIQGYFDGGFSCVITSTGESETDGEVEGSLTKQIGEMSGQLAVTQLSATLAKAAAAAAQQSADDAADAASAAQGSANAAAQAAAVADGKAVAASQAAAVADGKAVEAGAAASRANLAASNALTQLSIVEDVAGVLDWIQSHGSYVATTDTTVDPDTVYFEYDSTTQDYTPIVNPDPTKNPSTEGWYVLDISDSQSAFIMAHLAVTQRGLWVLPSGMGQAVDAQYAPNYKVLLASDGMYLYDGSGAQVVKYGSSIDLGSGRPFSIGTDNAYIVYYDSNNDGVADAMRIGGDVSIGGNKTLSEVLDDINGTLIYDTTCSYNNAHTQATLTAYLYRAGVDVKTEYSAQNFTWYLKTEDGEAPILNAQGNNYGYTCTVDLEDCGYGAEVIGRFTLVDNANALTNDYEPLTDRSGNDYTVRSIGDEVRVCDLTTTTTLFLTDKVMIVGAEDEHLVTVETLRDVVDKHYEHTQATASATWTITHNLNKFPSITVIDSAGSEVFGDVAYTNSNSLTLTFSGAFSGKAYLN